MPNFRSLLTLSALAFIHANLRADALSLEKRDTSLIAGTRTTYSNGTARSGAATADTTYSTTATGQVQVLQLFSRSNDASVSHMHAYESTWSSSSNVTISYKTFSEGVTYDTYVSEVLQACQSRTSGMFDLIWIDPLYIGKLAPCLEDLFAWNDAFGTGHIKALAQGGIVDERMVSLPSEMSMGALAVNYALLSSYGYSGVPDTISELTEMLTSIEETARSMDRFTLSGLAGSFIADENMTSSVVEWIAGIDASILSSDGSKVAMATTTVAQRLAEIIAYIDSGIIDPLDIGKTDQVAAIERFKAGNSILVRISTDDIKDLVSSSLSFDWGLSPIPSASSGSKGVGVAGGWGMGVYKYSSNLPASVRAVEFMTSSTYQKEKIVKSGMTYIFGTYTQFLLDRTVCSAYGTIYDTSICTSISNTQLVLRPTHLSGAFYKNVSSIVAQTAVGIFEGSLYVVSALEKLQTDLQTLLNLTNTTTETIVSPVITTTTKKSPDALITQLLGLGAVCAIMAVVVVLYRRKMAYDKSSEETAADSKKAGFTKIEDEEIDEDESLKVSQMPEEDKNQPLATKISI